MKLEEEGTAFLNFHHWSEAIAIREA